PDVIERQAAGAGLKQRARDVDHMARAGAFVDQRRAAAPAETAHGPTRLLFVARDRVLARRDAEALAPRADIRRVGGAVRAPTGSAVIVPGPERRIVDLEA